MSLLIMSHLMAQTEKHIPHTDNASRTWQGIPGLEVTEKGRIFISWYSGGSKEPAPQNTGYLCYSDDNGRNFTPPEPLVKPNDNGRSFDPTLWIDPEGRLWYIFNRGNKDNAYHAVYARICNKPDSKTPIWTNEFRVGYDVPYSFRMNKPTILSNGDWLMPVTHANEPIHGWFAGDKQLQSVGISNDKGKSWKLHGDIKAPPWALENMIVELLDGSLWMLIRTGSGYLWESRSTDSGRTWSKPNATLIASPGSRFFIRRLASGNLLLVNHYKFDGRSHLTAKISKNDGDTWNDGLILDERQNISYPDGVQDKNGLIWIVYDRERYKDGEILMATFHEKDVIAGEDVSGKVNLKQIINKLR
ncbi:sialidase family protein [Bacteroidota bacterium]